jgi:hypothetical protein
MMGGARGTITGGCVGGKLKTDGSMRWGMSDLLHYLCCFQCIRP